MLALQVGVDLLKDRLAPKEHLFISDRVASMIRVFVSSLCSVNHGFSPSSKMAAAKLSKSHHRLVE
jgi:hypothetical protein